MLSTPKAKAELYLASSLYDGLEDNNIVQVTTLLLNKEADPNVLIPSQGITPFHLVIGNDSETFAEEVTKLFLRHGGNPNVKSADGMTPVHVAAAWGRLGVLELLLSNGGDPLSVDDDGRSPFHYAFDEAHYDAVATLGKYCGETHEDNMDVKYNMALGKILVSNGGVVAEYVVADGTLLPLTADVPNPCTGNIFDNNGGSLGNRAGYSANKKNCVSQPAAGQPDNIDVTLTTTTDESSSCLQKFRNPNRYRRCLPRRKLGDVEPKLGDERKIELGEGEAVDAGGRFSVSHLNDAAIEASFVVKPRGAGENMPRVSSPKAGDNLVKLEYETGKESHSSESARKARLPDNKTATGKGKIVHKTPLRPRPNGKPFSEKRRTPSVTADKPLNPNIKATPKSREPLTNDKKAPAFRTPSKYVPKQNAYSADCSIVSKSPNLIVTPTVPTDPRYRKKTAYTPFGTTTPGKICNSGSGEKNFSRFAKQSDLRYRGTRKSPASSPNGFRSAATWSKRTARTPNLTDSAKRARNFPTIEKRIATTPSYPNAARSPATPLNKTYSKSKNFDAAGISPEVEATARYIDRRTLAKNVAIKLEETRYDDDCNGNASTDDSANNPEFEKNLATGTRPRFKVHPAVAENKISMVVDSRSNQRERMNRHRAAYSEHVGPSTVEREVIGGGNGAAPYFGLCHATRASHVIAGFFQPENANGGSIVTNNTDDMAKMTNMILRRSPRLGSNAASAVNFPATPRVRKPASLKTGLLNDANNKECGISRGLASTNHLKKEIDDSLVSSEASGSSLDNYTRNTDSSDLNDLGAPANGTVSPGNDLFRCNHGSEYESRQSQYNQGTGEHESANTPEGYPRCSQKTCLGLPNISSSVGSSSCASFLSVEEEYKYEDAEEGVVLLERRLLVTPVSIPVIKAEDGVSCPSGKSSVCLEDNSMESRVSSLPQSLAFMDSETLRRELTRLGGHPPGPITATTRQVYLKRLWKLKKRGPIPPPIAINTPPKFSAEVERTLRSENWMNDLSPYETLERQVFSEFAKPDPSRRWREGTTKSSFNYILMDARITDNLPRRADALSSTERWRTFLSSIFYVGKGKRSRPYSHLYEAYGEWKKKGNGKTTNDKKVERILDIWKNDYGVVCLHLFQNTIPVEAYTREAAIIDALGLGRLTNAKSGEYYGTAATWSQHQKRIFGLYMLYKAMHILMNEGERQLYPDNIGR